VTAQKRVLVVDNHDSFTHNLKQLINECGWMADLVTNDSLTQGNVCHYSKILISPGPGVPAEAGDVCAFVEAFAREKSILGVCLGHQALATVFGGKLVQLPRASHGVQTHVRITDKSHYLFAGLPERFEAGLYHSWTVSREGLPACLKVTAVSDEGTIMALSHNEYDVHGIQFHPESIMTPHGRTIMNNWLCH
jgi:anthranilate synthase component 2